MAQHHRFIASSVVACAVSSWLLIACAGKESALPSSARVVEIVDGDTVLVAIDGGRETVRLIGIDTPETKKPATPVECFGPEATEFLTSLIPPGTNVELHRDIESRDHFGRLLAYLFRRADGLFVNREILIKGFARTLSIPPNTTYSGDFDEVASRARRENEGLWQACRDVGIANQPPGGTPPTTSAR